MTENSSKSSSQRGNTIPSGFKKKQCSPAKGWCFTLNNYTCVEMEEVVAVLSSNSSNRYIFQEEIGESGTPHLQGYVKFHKKCRPFNLFKTKRIHWEKQKGTFQQAVDYCRKEEDRIVGTNVRTNIKFPKPVKVITQLYPWQKEIVAMLKKEPDDRVIHWIYEYDGGVGKTALIKKVCVEMEGLCLCGKASDMKCAISKVFETNKAAEPIILINIPRSHNIEYLSYSGIEQIKDGIFFSGKYESGMVIMNCPHLFIFANERPSVEKLSIDRWRIYQIKNKELVRERV